MDLFKPSKNKFYDLCIFLLLYTLWNVLISYFYYSFLQGFKLSYTPVEITRVEFFENIVFAPIWEEFVFRWAPITIILTIFDTFTAKKLLWPVIVISSYIFGWGHDGNGIENLLLQGVGGLFLSVLYIRTNKIEYNILFHTIWNTFCLLYWDQLSFISS